MSRAPGLSAEDKAALLAAQKAKAAQATTTETEPRLATTKGGLSYLDQQALNQAIAERAKRQTTQQTQTFDQQTQRVYEDYQRGKITAQDVKEYVDKSLEQQGITEKPLITEAPEGYYYEAEGEGGYKEYNRQVIEYNRQVRAYKQGLINSITAPQPKTPYGYGTAAEREPDALDMVFGPPSDMGPPEPTEAERLNIEAGLTAEGRIPGPWMGPKPGTIGAAAQESLTPRVMGAFGVIEAPFRAVTEPARGLSMRLEEASIEAAKQPGIAPVLGFAEYGTAKLLNLGAVAIDVATFEFRPQLWVDISRTIGGVVVSPETREAVAGQILKDPFGFTFETVGGIAAGGYIKTRAIPELEARLKAIDWEKVSSRVAEAIPQENPYRGMTAYDRYIATQPLKVKPFMEGPAEPMYTGEQLRSPRLDALLREAEQAVKIRPIPTIPTETYRPSASLYEATATPSVAEVKARVFLRTLEQELKLRPSLRIPTETYLPAASLYVMPGAPSTLEVRARIAARTLWQETKLRPIIKFPTETYGPAASLYTPTGAPSLAEVKLRQTIRTLQQEVKLRPTFKIPTETVGESAQLYGAPSTPSTLETRVRILARELKQGTKLRPGPNFLTESHGYEPFKPKVTVEPFQPFKPPVSEQIEAVDLYTKNTYTARSESFMSRTFTSTRIPATGPEFDPTRQLKLPEARILPESTLKLPESKGLPSLYLPPPKQQKKGPWGGESGWAKLSNAYFPKMPPELEKQVIDLEKGVKTTTKQKPQTIQPLKEKKITLPTLESATLEKPVARPEEKTITMPQITPRQERKTIAGLTPISIQTPVQIPEQNQRQEQRQRVSLILEQAQTQRSVMLTAQPLYEPSEEKRRRKRRYEFEERILPLATEKQIMESVFGEKTKLRSIKI